MDEPSISQLSFLVNELRKTQKDLFEAEFKKQRIEKEILSILSESNLEETIVTDESDSHDIKLVTEKDARDIVLPDKVTELLELLKKENKNYLYSIKIDFDTDELYRLLLKNPENKEIMSCFDLQKAKDKLGWFDMTQSEEQDEEENKSKGGFNNGQMFYYG